MARAIAWCFVVVLAVLWALEGLIIARTLMRRVPPPGEGFFVLLLFPTILMIIRVYGCIEACGFQFSLLGPLKPKPIPREAWRGEVVDWGGGRVGRFGGAACWIVSPQGILLTYLIFTVFVSWEDIVSVEQIPRRGLSKFFDFTWMINHKARDVRSPLFCREGVIQAIVRVNGRLPGATDHQKGHSSSE